MPTKERLNISIVDEECIKELKKLRKYLENVTDKRLSFADIIKAALIVRPSDIGLTKYL